MAGCGLGRLPLCTIWTVPPGGTFALRAGTSLTHTFSFPSNSADEEDASLQIHFNFAFPPKVPSNVDFGGEFGDSYLSEGRKTC